MAKKAEVFKGKPNAAGTDYQEDLSRLLAFWQQSRTTYDKVKTETKDVWDKFHGEQIPSAVKLMNEKRGQPSQIYNIVRSQALRLAGFITANRKLFIAKPRTTTAPFKANLMQNTLSAEAKDNNLEVESFDYALSMIINGFSCVYVDAVESGRHDEWGRPIYKLDIDYVPEFELYLDPLSIDLDYQDARYIHRLKMLSRQDVEDIWGEEVCNSLVPNKSLLNTNSEWNSSPIVQQKTETQFFEICHTIIKEKSGKYVSYFWAYNKVLSKQDVSKSLFPMKYVVRKVMRFRPGELYGIFKDLIGTQDAINQALQQQQALLVNIKVFVESGAYDKQVYGKDQDFTDAVNTPTETVFLEQGALAAGRLKVEKWEAEIKQLDDMINQKLQWVENILHINPAFAGEAAASDSGKKVQVMQDAAIMGMRYLPNSFDGFLISIGKACSKLIAQYFTAYSVIRYQDKFQREQLFEINKPMIMAWTGTPLMVRWTDPDTGKPRRDENGQWIVEPVSDPLFTLDDVEVDITIETAPSGVGSEEDNQMLTSIITNPNMPMMIGVPNYLEINALLIEGMKTKNSERVAEILRGVAQAQQQMQQGVVYGQGGAPQPGQPPIEGAQVKPQGLLDVNGQTG